jgi:hypothetical protein
MKLCLIDYYRVCAIAIILRNIPILTVLCYLEKGTLFTYLSKMVISLVSVIMTRSLHL